eukprot:597530-Pelagomonas_calceolata.AAC.2
MLPCCRADNGGSNLDEEVPVSCLTLVTHLTQNAEVQGIMRMERAQHQWYTEVRLKFGVVGKKVLEVHVRQWRSMHGWTCAAHPSGFL